MHIVCSYLRQITKF